MTPFNRFVVLFLISVPAWSMTFDEADRIYDCEIDPRAGVSVANVNRMSDSGAQVRYQYCATRVHCYENGKPQQWFSLTTGLVGKGVCPGYRTWPRRGEKEIQVLKAELYPKATLSQTDSVGRKCLYNATEEGMKAVYREYSGAEDGWDTHCLNQVWCKANSNAKEEFKFAACPYVGTRTLADGKTVIVQCPGPVDCMKNGYKVEPARVVE